MSKRKNSSRALTTLQHLNVIAVVVATTPIRGFSTLFEALHVRDQRLQIIRRQIDGRHAACVHLQGGMFEKFG
jgi:hypothetical protein